MYEYLYVCVYVCMYICVCICMCVCMYVCMCVDMCVCVYYVSGAYVVAAGGGLRDCRIRATVDPLDRLLLTDSPRVMRESSEREATLGNAGTRSRSVS